MSWQIVLGLLVVIGVTTLFNIIFFSLRKKHSTLRREQDFIANASHELRTPITIIRGFAETLQDIPDLSKERLHEITEKIVRTCIRIDKLVKSLITLSDLDHISKDRMQVVDLVSLSEKCRDQLLFIYPHVEVDLRCEIKSAPVFAEVDLIEMALLNLLENAVKYSSGHAEIEITLKVIKDEVELSIKDHGIGIREKDLPHIFDRFYTVNKAHSRRFGGAGLGLSIVKNVIEKHQGKIGVQSELGKGTTFTIVLPYCK